MTHMNLYDEFFTIIRLLNDSAIDYAVVGGIALSFHVEPRYTKDIDLLVSSTHVDTLKESLRSRGYTFEVEPWSFKNTDITLHRLSKVSGEDTMTIDILVGNEPRHEEIIKHAIVDDSEQGLVKIARKQDLIWLKKFRNSKQDIADIEALENDED